MLTGLAALHPCNHPAVPMAITPANIAQSMEYVITGNTLHSSLRIQVFHELNINAISKSSLTEYAFSSLKAAQVMTFLFLFCMYDL